MKSYQEKSDRVWYEFKKTFRNLKKEQKPPRFSFIMSLVKKFGDDEVVKRLGQLREQNNFHQITDFIKYIKKMF